MTQAANAGAPLPGPPTAWTCTGVSWRGGHPSMTMIDASGRELSHALRRGEPLGLRVTGPRRCVGLWRGNLRSCPFDALIAASDNGSQCEACAWADPGRALARDATADDRDFRLYVATFGADVLKVGISALERGDERLLEQGALAFTWIGQGPHQVIRAAETAIATAGLAPERRRRATKIAGWHTRGNPEDRRAALEKVAAAAQRLPNWPTLAERTPVAVVDHADRVRAQRTACPPRRHRRPRSRCHFGGSDPLHHRNRARPRPEHRQPQNQQQQGSRTRRQWTDAGGLAHHTGTRSDERKSSRLPHAARPKLCWPGGRCDTSGPVLRPPPPSAPRLQAQDPNVR